jgi:hypothetical protein
LVELLHHLLLGLIRSLQLFEQRLLLVLKLAGYALSPRRAVKSRLDPVRVHVRIVVVGIVSTHIGVELGLHLSIFHVLEGSLFLAQVIRPVHVDDISDLLLLGLDFGESATVASLEVVTLHFDRVLRACAHLIEAGTIEVLGLLVFDLVRHHHIHFILLNIVHVLDEVLSALEVLNSLVGAFLFLQKLDNSRLDGRLLVFHLPLMDHGLHHVSLGT